MDDLVQWFGKQLEKDTAEVQEAANEYGAEWTAHPGMDSVSSNTGADVIDEPGAPLGHIAEWDPARVLREIDAKRKLLDVHRAVKQRSTGSGGGLVQDCEACGHFPAQYPCLTLRLLALPYADRPGYREEWRP